MSREIYRWVMCLNPVSSFLYQQEFFSILKIITSKYFLFNFSNVSLTTLLTFVDITPFSGYPHRAFTINNTVLFVNFSHFSSF